MWFYMNVIITEEKDHLPINLGLLLFLDLNYQIIYVIHPYINFSFLRQFESEETIFNALFSYLGSLCMK